MDHSFVIANQLNMMVRNNRMLEGQLIQLLQPMSVDTWYGVQQHLIRMGWNSEGYLSNNLDLVYTDITGIGSVRLRPIHLPSSRIHQR